MTPALTQVRKALPRLRALVLEHGSAAQKKANGNRDYRKFSTIRQEMLATIDEALAAIDAAQGGVVPKVKVRALEWVDRGLGILYADSVVGTYKVNLDGYWWRDDGPLEGRGGQSAVRADYERRVLSALDLPLPPVGA